MNIFQEDKHLNLLLFIVLTPKKQLQDCIDVPVGWVQSVNTEDTLIEIHLRQDSFKQKTHMLGIYINMF